MNSILSKGAWFFLGFLLTFALLLTWNSNHMYPEREARPVPLIDKYVIITNRGICTVVETEEKQILFKGDFPGECEMYLRNIGQ